MFIGGPVGALYSKALVARELFKAAPMLYSVATMLGGSDETPTWINSIAAQGEKFTGGTSQYAKEHVFSFENFGNLISDVALQWGQMTTISESVNKLRGATNYIDDATKQAHALYKAKKSTLGAQAALDDVDWKSSPLGQACLKKFLPDAEKATKAATQLGRDMALGYMAVVSNSDVYNDMLIYGANETEAAAVALGSTIGMFALNKYTNLGEIFFDDATENSVKMARLAVKKEIREASPIFAQIKNSKASPTKKLLKFMNVASEKSKKVMSQFSEDLKYHTTNFVGKAVGEGLEEVSEELITDTAKSIYELAGKFGYDTTVKDVGAWDHSFERYTMSLLGGMIGGGIFYGKQALAGQYQKNIADEEISTLIRNGYANVLREEVNKVKSKGKAGNVHLSASKYEIGEDGKPLWLTTQNKADSQNDFIAQLVLDKINAIEAVINNNQVNLSDEDLFKQMVLSEARYWRYKDISGITNYYQDFNNVINDLLKAEFDYKAASGTLEGVVGGTPLNDSDLRSLSPEQQQNRVEQLQKLKDKLEEARNKKNDFLSGNTSLDYTRKLNFAIDPILHANYLAIDEIQLWKQHYGDKPMLEDPAEYAKFVSTILEPYRKNALKENITASWERHKQVEQVILPYLQQLAIDTPKFKEWFQTFNQLSESDVFNTKELVKSYLNYDSKLDNESEEDYKFRNTKKTITLDDGTILEESDDDFNFRKNKRVDEINSINDSKDAAWVNMVLEKLQEVNYNLDPISARALLKTIPRRAKDIINYKIAQSDISNKKQEILSKLNADLSNIKEIQELLKQNIDYKEPIINFIEILKNSKDDDGNNFDLTNIFNENSSDYDPEFDDVTIGDFIREPETWFVWSEKTNDDIKKGLESIIRNLEQAGLADIYNTKISSLIEALLELDASAYIS